MYEEFGAIGPEASKQGSLSNRRACGKESSTEAFLSVERPARRIPRDVHDVSSSNCQVLCQVRFLYYGACSWINVIITASSVSLACSARCAPQEWGIAAAYEQAFQVLATQSQRRIRFGF